MADDIDAVQSSLAEIKLLLQNKKKETSGAITAEVFTDPRFVELFENYFKPLIESSKDIKGKLTEKRKISVFDVLGISDRMQESKRNALIKEVEKLTDKVRNIAKNLGNVRHYTISDILGLTKTERTNNRRMINNAIRSLSLSIHQSARILGDPNNIIKFLGIKPIKLPKEKKEKAEAPVAIRAPITVEPPVAIPVKGTRAGEGVTAISAPELPKKRGRKKVKIDTSTDIPESSVAVPHTPSLPVDTKHIPSIADSVPVGGMSLAERATAERRVTPVAIVEISDSIQEWFEKISLKGVGGVDKGIHTGEDRESYSHSANALARLLTLGAGLLAMGIPTLFKGLFDQGPLKGIEKMVSSYSLQMVGKIGKGIIHYIGNFFPKVMKAVTQAFSGELSVGVAKSFIKRGVIGKSAARLLGFIGKIAKRIPGIGALISIGFAFNRFANGDIQGGLIDLASGAASTIPIIGTAVSIGLDIINAQADYASGGVTSKKKGWIGKFNDYLGKMFSKLIYASLSQLPFGLGEKVAGWMGLDIQGLAAASNENEDVSINPAVEKSRARIKLAQDVRKKSQTRQQNILKGRKIEELSDVERSEYENENSIIHRAEKSIADNTNTIRGTGLKKHATTENKNSIPADNTIKQTSTAAEENENEATQTPNTIEEQSENAVRVDRPYNPPVAVQHTRENETVSTLKQINANIETMNAKTPSPVQQSNITPFVNVSSIGGNGGNGNNSPLQFAIEAVRDTCYNSREKSRNMILDFRAFA